jgi:uncharacterized protein YdaU (DUF1376 family)
MSGRPWYAFYPDAYERDAGNLTYVQDSAYRRMLDHYYKTGAPLPADKDSLYRSCRALKREERAAIDFCLGLFFEFRADGYHQQRADDEIAKAVEISGKRAKAASNRHNKKSANEDAFAEQLHTHSTATTTEERSSLRDDAKPRAKARRSLPEIFPLEPDQDWARAHWLAKGRADLCNAMTEEIEKFRDHHAGRATMSADWPGSWRTWARLAMNFTKTPVKISSFPTAIIHKVA